MFGSVKTETTTSRGYESPYIFIKVVLLFGQKIYLEYLGSWKKLLLKTKNDPFQDTNINDENTLMRLN
jgi:hypothetical protein